VIEVKGLNGESLIYDGATLTKFRHNGLEEAMRNPVSSYRQTQVKAKKRKKETDEQQYEVLIACQGFFSLTITEAAKPVLDDLIAQLHQDSGKAS